MVEQDLELSTVYGTDGNMGNALAENFEAEEANGVAVTANPFDASGLDPALYINVQAGGEVAVGQVIGLIEAMKLFNEIKSDLAGRVVKVVPESGTLVKAKQPLIEVEPL